MTQCSFRIITCTFFFFFFFLIHQIKTRQCQLNYAYVLKATLEKLLRQSGEQPCWPFPILVLSLTELKWQLSSARENCGILNMIVKNQHRLSVLGTYSSCNGCRARKHWRTSYRSVSTCQHWNLCYMMLHPTSSNTWWDSSARCCHMTPRHDGSSSQVVVWRKSRKSRQTQELRWLNMSTQSTTAILRKLSSEYGEVFKENGWKHKVISVTLKKNLYDSYEKVSLHSQQKHFKIMIFLNTVCRIVVTFERYSFMTLLVTMTLF